MVWYSLAQGAAPDFNLVGVTESWGLVLFGDNVKSPSLEGTTTAHITGDAYPLRKNTLLEDIFGKSAFDNVTYSTVVTETSSFVSQRGKQAVSSFFDKPAYLMPPLETMFDSIMQSSFLTRSTTEGVADHGRETQNDDEEMDVDEDQTPENAPFIAENATRIVDEREMYEFVEIFKQYGVKCMWNHRMFYRYCSSIDNVGLQPQILARRPRVHTRMADTVYLRVLMAPRQSPPRQNPTALQSHPPQGAMAIPWLRHRKYRLVLLRPRQLL